MTWFTFVIFIKIIFGGNQKKNLKSNYHILKDIYAFKVNEKFILEERKKSKLAKFYSWVVSKIRI